MKGKDMMKMKLFTLTLVLMLTGGTLGTLIIPPGTIGYAVVCPRTFAGVDVKYQAAVVDEPNSDCYIQVLYPGMYFLPGSDVLDIWFQNKPVYDSSNKPYVRPGQGHDSLNFGSGKG